MKKLLPLTFLLFIATAQTSQAGVQIGGATLCQYTATSTILTATVTDASGVPKPFTGVRFSVVSGTPAEFIYPVTYTNEQGVAATVLSLIGSPTGSQVQIQAQDQSTGEIASSNVAVKLGFVCEISIFNFDPITAVAGSSYIASGFNGGWGWYSPSFTAYSTDPRVAVPTRGTVGAFTFNGQAVVLDISPRQAGQAYILVPNASGVPITVQAADVNAPVITSQPTTSTDIYQPYLYQVIAGSPLGKTLTYHLAAGPVGMKINAQTGALDWVPGFNDAGETVVKLTVSDGLLSTYQHFRLQVNSSQSAIFVGSVAVSGESGTMISWLPLVKSSFNPISPTCAIETAPANGTATVVADCSSGSYQSKPGFIGIDNFVYSAYICPTPTGPCYFGSATVTVAVTEPQGDPACLKQYPVTQFSQAGKEGTLTISFTGNITSHTNKEMKVCPGTTLNYQSTSTQGPVICKIRNSTTRGSGSLKINDHLKCTDKPAGKDKVHFKVKSGVK